MPFKFSDKVKQVLLKSGISEEELIEMVEHSALCSHSKGTRRYHRWVFNVTQSDHRTVVEAMGLYEFPTQLVLQGTQDFERNDQDDHEPCAGEGCPGCGWWGEVVTKYLAKIKRPSSGNTRSVY